MKSPYLEAGRIVNTHGIQGEVKIEPWADSADFLLGFRTFYIDGVPTAVLSARVHGRMVLARLEGIGDINAAMRLKNRIVQIARKDAKLPKGGFFIADLIGASVMEENGRELGKITEVLDLPAGNVYVVRGEREHMIPAVPEFILNTDIDKGVVTVRLIEGM
jgi:16S rRNA processing protein RimM